MTTTITLTDEQTAAIKADVFNDHERMVLTGLLWKEAEDCRTRAQDPNNYLWNNSEGAGATYLRLMRKVDAEKHAQFVKRYGDPYRWRLGAGLPNGVAG